MGGDSVQFLELVEFREILSKWREAGRDRFSQGDVVTAPCRGIGVIIAPTPRGFLVKWYRGWARGRTTEEFPASLSPYDGG